MIFLNFFPKASLSIQKKYQRRAQAPWLENVNLTPDLIYRYQMDTKSIADVLKADLNILNENKQVFIFNTINFKFFM